ncbi:hypothetical protein I316_00603 [Kwoniella heveanensis BCC8398]|uniref:Uncharacterized protein n=1 Tax=Kwoniella heveanensis BCC8398 TaxID=1296120 RepID=A0A1B9H2J2_9TREE|nr:hypothetical protein I316_00603 [Kwoniella heveanensis BCC8398]
MSWYASKTETCSRSRPQRPQRRRSSPPPGHHGQPQQQGYAAYYAGAEELFDSTSSSEEAAPHPMPGSGRYVRRSREVHQARPLPVTRPDSHIKRPPGPTDEETARSLSMQEDMLNVYNQLKRDQDALRSRDERDARQERPPRPTRHSAPPDSEDREDASRARPRPERPRRSIKVHMTRDHHNNRTEDTGTSRHRQNQDGPQTTNSRSAERRKRNNEFIESLEEEMICPICMSIMRAIDPTNPLTPARSLENAIKKWVDWKVAVEVEWQGLADFKDREESPGRLVLVRPSDTPYTYSTVHIKVRSPHSHS